MTDTPEHPWKAAPAGVVVRVRVTPKSSKDAVEGLEATAEGTALKVRVRAIPADGEANEAVRAALAHWLQVPKSALSLVSGAKSRVKSFAVAGETAGLEVILLRKTAALVTGRR